MTGIYAIGTTLSLIQGIRVRGVEGEMPGSTWYEVQVALADRPRLWRFVEESVLAAVDAFIRDYRAAHALPADTTR